MEARARNLPRPPLCASAGTDANGEARGSRISQALKLRGVRKQQALAAELNVHESAITRWKNGGAMSLDNAIALCGALNISADWLLLGRGTVEAPQSNVCAPRAGTAADLTMLDLPISVSIETQAKLQVFIRALAGDFQRRV